MLLSKCALFPFRCPCLPCVLCRSSAFMWSSHPNPCASMTFHVSHIPQSLSCVKFDWSFAVTCVMCHKINCVVSWSLAVKVMGATRIDMQDRTPRVSCILIAWNAFMGNPTGDYLLFLYKAGHILSSDSQCIFHSNRTSFSNWALKKKPLELLFLAQVSSRLGLTSTPVKAPLMLRLLR